MITSTYEPCVCVQDAEENSGEGVERKPKPQEGGLCRNPHTVVGGVLLLCCCFVAMHIASRSAGRRGESTSNLLAQSCGWLA